MSNITTVIANLCRDPEPLTLGTREVMKLRLADNTGQKNETRFFGAIVSGYDVETCARLKSGDKIVVTGQMVVSSYKAKKAGKNVKKGDTLKSDEMPFAKIVEVVKSETYFGGSDTAAPADAPEAADDDDGVDPLADL